MSFFEDVGAEFVKLMEGIGMFLGMTGPSGFKVATDIMLQVAEGGTTPQQVAATAADLVAFGEAVKAAVEATKAATGTSITSVISPTVGVIGMRG